MARQARRHTAAPYFHVTNRAARKERIFLRPKDYRAFVQVLTEGLERHPVRLLSYCLLSNHWHLVLGPPSTMALTDFVKWVTATHAIRWHRAHQSVGFGPVYQGRFHAEPIEQPGQLVSVMRYVERNALSAGLVSRAQDWPWCSLADRLRPDPDLPLVCAPYLASDSWMAYVNSILTTRDRLGCRLTFVPRTPETVEKSYVPLSRDLLDHLPEDPGRFAGAVERVE